MFILKIERPFTPELCVSAQKLIKQYILPGKRVLELGSGYSTLWFLEMGCHVVSFEHSLEWYTEVSKAATTPHPNLKIHLIPEN